MKLYQCDGCGETGEDAAVEMYTPRGERHLCGECWDDLRPFIALRDTELEVNRVE